MASVSECPRYSMPAHRGLSRTAWCPRCPNMIPVSVEQAKAATNDAVENVITIKLTRGDRRDEFRVQE